MKKHGATSPVFRQFTGKSPNKLFANLPSPCYIIDEEKLDINGKILSSVAEHTGCKILLAQKAFSNFTFYPILSKYLAGTEASGLYEARLGAEEMPDKEVHVFAAAYRDDEFEQLLKYADHIVFNSPSQLKKFGKVAKEHGKSVGLRINPLHSTQDGHDVYDPCSKGSRLGTTRDVFDRDMTEELIGLLDGLHFHTLCEQNSDDLATTYNEVEKQFGDILPKLKWLNMGGGHHITRDDYDIELLEKTIISARDKFGVEVYLEPGEAVALNAGYLVTRILDIVENSGTLIAILDVSAACHTPDVIEMPYIPPLYNATDEETPYIYRLAGPTCLAGDVIGDFYFPTPLTVGDMLIFGDMAIYTTCKNNTFNGQALPSIWRLCSNGNCEKVVSFDYDDFKMRLG